MCHCPSDNPQYLTTLPHSVKCGHQMGIRSYGYRIFVFFVPPTCGVLKRCAMHRATPTTVGLLLARSGAGRGLLDPTESYCETFTVISTASRSFTPTHAAEAHNTVRPDPIPNKEKQTKKRLDAERSNHSSAQMHSISISPPAGSAATANAARAGGSSGKYSP